MNDVEIKSLLNRAKAYANSKRFAQHSDDFAQEVYIAYARGRKATLARLFIDFLRKEYGRTGTVGGSAKSHARLNGLSFDTPKKQGDNEVNLSDIIASPGGEPDAFGSDWRSKVLFTGRKALIADLYLDHEWTEKKIGELLGVTEAAISIQIRIIKKEIEKAALLDERLDIYNDDSEYSKLNINWITL